MSAPFDLYTERRLPTEDIIQLWIHSPTGNNDSAGTLTAPLASLEEALARIPSILWGRRVVIHVLAGHTETLLRPLVFPPIIGADTIDDLSLTATEPSWDYQRPQIMIQAAPVTVQEITGTLSAEATTGLQTITVAGAGWTTNEHVGRAVINPGAPSENAIIWGNTATELFVTAANLSDGTLRIVRRDATFTLGNPDAFPDTTAGLIVNGCVASISFVGLTIRNPGSASADVALSLICQKSVNFMLCELDGGVYLRAGSGEVYFDSCYIHSGSMALNGQATGIRQCYLSGLTMNFHGGGGAGIYYYSTCRISACGALGHGGTSLPDGGFEVASCWISGGTSHGVLYEGGNRARVTFCRIDSCAGDAIRADGSGNLHVFGCTGSGNTGYGCYADRGAIIEHSTTVPTVTGTSGQVRLGGVASGVTYTWSQTPQTHARGSMFCVF